MKMRICTIGMLLMGLMGSAVAEPVDRAVINALSPIVFQVMLEIETERGKPFATHEELAVAMATDEFQAKTQSALKSFCSLPENAYVLACAQQPGTMRRSIQ